jgi:hypothetical protein
LNIGDVLRGQCGQTLPREREKWRRGEPLRMRFAQG